MKIILKTISIVTTITFLVACGGSDEPVVTTDSNTASGKLPGKLLIAQFQRNYYAYMDLSTGSYSSLPGLTKNDVSQVASAPLFDFWIEPTPSGTESVLSINGCEKRPELGRTDCIYLHDHTNQTNTPVIAKGIGATGDNELVEITLGAELSHDGEYLAFAYNYDFDHKLYIVDRNGRHVAVFPLHKFYPENKRDIAEYEWMPDGRLIYSFGKTIGLIAPPYEIAKRLKTIEGRGFPNDLALSPDGTQLAFTLTTRCETGGIVGSRGCFGTVWVMDMNDPNSLHELAYLPNNDDPSIEYPMWSPDGKWIMVKKGSLDVGYGPDDGALFAVPSDGVRVPLGAEETTAIPIRGMHAAMIHGESKVNAQYDLTTKFDSIPVRWIP
jgi:WD40 repeat protein